MTASPAYLYDLERSLESRHCIYSRRNIYIMLEDVEINWDWTFEEVRNFDKWLRAGMNVVQLANKFGRTHEEIVLMTIDRTLRDNLKARKDEGTEKYVMLETIKINWFWDTKDVIMFDLYHGMGLNYQMIADKLGRTEAEIIIMTFDRAMQDKLGDAG